MRSDLGWTPDGWSDYGKWYPKTPPISTPDNSNIDRFFNIWETHEANNLTSQATACAGGRRVFVLVRGVFGNLMPGNFVPLLRYLNQGDTLALRPRVYVVDTIANGAALLHRQVRAKLDAGDEIFWLCQSRGGLDTLCALIEYPQLRERTAGVILVQTPSAASVIMQSILTEDHAETMTRRRTRIVEKLQQSILTLPPFQRGCRQLVSPGIDEYVEAAQGYAFEFPILAVATWSIEPTSWVDSFHRRLGEIRPECAHDGQFYLEDQLWPVADQLILGHIDHAQSVMGGNGFDLVRFWTTLITMLDEQVGRKSVTRSAILQKRNPNSI